MSVAPHADPADDDCATFETTTTVSANATKATPLCIGRVVQDVLQVERQDEELRERDRADDRHRRVRGGERAERKIRSGRSGDGERSSISDERADQRGGGRRQPERRRSRPSRRSSRASSRRRAASDRPSPRPRPARSKWRCARSARLSRSSSGVSAIAARPTGTLMKKTHDQLRYEVSSAAEQDARGRAAAGGRAVDAEREVPLAALGEGRHQQRERGRCEQRAAEALQSAEGDERAFRPGEPAEQRAGGEEREPADEQPAAAEQVGEPAAQQQRAAEEDGVGRDRPTGGCSARSRGRPGSTAARRSRSRRRG